MSSDPAAAAAPFVSSAAALVSALPPGSWVPALVQSTPADLTEARDLWSRLMGSFNGSAFGSTTQNQLADPAASGQTQRASGSSGAAAGFAPALVPPPAAFFAAPAAGFFSAPAAGAGLFSTPPAQSFGATFGAPAASPFSVAAGPSTLFSAPPASFFSAPAPASASAFVFSNVFGAQAINAALKKETSADASAALSSSAGPCLMLLAMVRDTGVQFYLTEFLSWQAMSALHRTCSQWRHWLDEGKLGSAVEVRIKPENYSSLERCKWVQRFINSLVLRPQLRGESKIEEVQECLRSVLARIHRLPRLRELSLSLHADIEPSADEISGCFESVATRLESFTLIRAHGPSRVPAVVLRAIQYLPQLRSFTLSCSNLLDRDTVDLSPLLCCPLLSSFTFEMGRSYSLHWFPSAAHLQTILQCKQLTSLDMGDWSGQHDGEATLAILARTKASDSKSAAVAAAAGKAVPSDCVPLRFLDLSRTAINSARFALLSDFTSLETLSPASWGSDLDAQDWLRLTQFPSLQLITIHGEAATTSNTNVLQLADQSAEEQQVSMELKAKAVTLVFNFMPALLRCASLTTVRLGFGLELSADHLTAIIQSLPLLTCLELRYMNVETCAPLAGAPRLTSLVIDHCFGVRGSHANWRVDLPALPSLTSLMLHDSTEFLLSRVQSERWNPALKARMPLLLEFKQNLLKPPKSLFMRVENMLGP